MTLRLRFKFLFSLLTINSQRGERFSGFITAALRLNHVNRNLRRNRKVLGVTISNDLKWNDHVDTITSKAARRLYLLSQLKRAGICSDNLLAFYCSVIRSVLEFSCQLFHRSLPKYLSDDIERIQRSAMRIIFPILSYCEALDKAGIVTLSERRESLSIKLFEDIVSNEHHKLANLLPPMASSHARRLRNKKRFNTPVCRTDRFMNSQFTISHAM